MRTALFLFAFVIYITDAATFHEDNLDEIQKYEESARRMWDLSMKILKEDPDKVELFTWFPWFENPTRYYTIKAVTTLENENSSKLLPELGVGSWHEIILFGKRNSNERPDAKAFLRNSTSNLSGTFTWILAVFVCLMHQPVFFKS